MEEPPVKCGTKVTDSSELKAIRPEAHIKLRFSKGRP
jgi:hypothetical protein